MASIECLGGLWGLWQLIDLCSYKMRTGNDAGMGWLLLPMLAAFSLFFFLGIGLLLGKKIALYLHFIFIPVIIFTVLATNIFLGSTGPFFIIHSCAYLLLCIMDLLYLSSRKFRENFS
jgi:hypothetical protein